MNQINNKRKRILALIWSGILVVVVLPIIGIMISVLIDNLFAFPQLISFPFNIIIAIPLLLWGFFWAIWSNIELYKVGQGSPIPREDIHTIKVVSSGPYKYCRNPMIFGYIFLWVGLGLLLNSFFLTFGISLLVSLLLIIMVKVWEEKHLEKVFGDPYIQYKSEVPFVIPFLKKKKKSKKYSKNDS
ncbi:MAG: methyltransferase family protein [Promethearchaeota archaeon]